MTTPALQELFRVAIVGRAMRRVWAAAHLAVLASFGLFAACVHMESGVSFPDALLESSHFFSEGRQSFVSSTKAYELYMREKGGLPDFDVMQAFVSEYGGEAVVRKMMMEPFFGETEYHWVTYDRVNGADGILASFEAWAQRTGWQLLRDEPIAFEEDSRLVRVFGKGEAQMKVELSASGRATREHVGDAPQWDVEYSLMFDFVGVRPEDVLGPQYRNAPIGLQTR